MAPSPGPAPSGAPGWRSEAPTAALGQAPRCLQAGSDTSSTSLSNIITRHGSFQDPPPSPAVLTVAWRQAFMASSSKPILKFAWKRSLRPTWILDPYFGLLFIPMRFVEWTESRDGRFRMKSLIPRITEVYPQQDCASHSSSPTRTRNNRRQISSSTIPDNSRCHIWEHVEPFIGRRDVRIFCRVHAHRGLSPHHELRILRLKDAGRSLQKISWPNSGLQGRPF